MTEKPLLSRWRIRKADVSLLSFAARIFDLALKPTVKKLEIFSGEMMTISSLSLEEETMSGKVAVED